MALKIFISHSAVDGPLASALVDFLLSSMVLDDDEIRCTSVPGHKLPVGCDFSETLLNDLEDTAVVVGLVTKNAVASSWVLFELGATWGARKALRPLVTDEVDLKTLPGALSGKHVARLSKSSDVYQFLEELTSTIQAKPRSRPKIDKALAELLLAHASHLAASTPPKLRTKAQADIVQPTIAGVPFFELENILRKEKITVPARHAGGKEDVQHSLLELFWSSDKEFANGLQSNYGKDSVGAFLYQEVGLRLLQFRLVQFEKLPAAQAKYFKSLITSDEGNKFLLHIKRLSNKPKEGDASS
jgi:hypothetical protein